MNVDSRNSVARGRRATRSAEVRNALLDTAEALVGERQAAAITARDIARSAGVSDGVLYNHFGDKHELLLAALLRRFERLVAVFEAEVASAAAAVASGGAPGLSPDARLDGLVDASFRLHAGALPMLANVLSEPALFRRLMVEIHRPPLGVRVFREPIEAHLRDARDDGAIGEVDPVAAADLLVGAILLIALTDLAAPRPRDVIAARLRAAVRTLAVGLAPRTITG